MTKLTIDISSEQYQAIKMMAVKEGKSIKDFVLERTVGDGEPKERKLGQWKNQVWMSDDFGDWPDDVAEALGMKEE